MPGAGEEGREELSALLCADGEASRLCSSNWTEGARMLPGGLWVWVVLGPEEASFFVCEAAVEASRLTGGASEAVPWCAASPSTDDIIAARTAGHYEVGRLRSKRRQPLQERCDPRPEMDESDPLSEVARDEVGRRPEKGCVSGRTGEMK